MAQLVQSLSALLLKQPLLAAAGEMLRFSLALACLAAGAMTVIVVAIYGNLWFLAFMSGARVGLTDLVGMSLRNVNPRSIVEAKIMASYRLISPTSRWARTSAPGCRWSRPRPP